MEIKSVELPSARHIAVKDGDPVAEEHLQLYASVFHHVGEAVMITSPEGTIVEVNEAFVRITGYVREEAIGCNPRILNSHRQGRAFFASMWRGLIENGFWEGDIWNRRKDGTIYLQHETINEVRNISGRVGHYVAIFSDVTKSRGHERAIEMVARYDALTHLPNRQLLADRVNQALPRARKSGGRVAIASVDLDGFGYVNDTYGHDAGDLVLVEVARRLSGSVGKGDDIFRLGGDEFVLLLIDVGTGKDIETLLDQMLSVISAPIYIGDGRYVELSGSIGYTLYPDDDADPDTLLRHADHAMFDAKQAGKNRFHRFNLELNLRAKANWGALAKIEHALDAGQFRLFVQPKIDLATGRLAGAEALIRWMHPIRGVIPPAQFIPLLEGQDLALRVGEWVLREGLGLLRDFDRQGIKVPLSVNVDARQLREADMAQQIADLLALFPDVPPGLLELEIVESMALDDIDQVSQIISACQSLGVKFSLDDFGTGFSSLTYLKRLGVDTLKIDQSFVRDMLGETGAMAIVRGVIGLARAFDNHTVAEGVETWEQAAKLKALGCEMIQGYAVARPMPADELPAWLASFRLPAI